MLHEDRLNTNFIKNIFELAQIIIINYDVSGTTEWKI